MREYAISLGFNAESCAFDGIVKNMENLQDYIVERKKDPKDSMYNKFDAIVKEITEKF